MTAFLGRPVANGNGAALVKADPIPEPAPLEAQPEEAKGAPIFSPGFFSPNGQRIYYLGGTPSSEVETVNSRTAYAAAVYAYVAMRWRAEKYAEPGIFVAELDDAGDVGEWVPGHPLEDFLDLPHPDVDMGELLRTSRLYRDFSGSCLWLKEADRAGRPARVTPFHGDEFTVEAAQVGGVNRLHGKFTVTTRAGSLTAWPDDVVYFRETSPYGWNAGLAPLDTALAMLNLGKTATTTVRTILRNALFPSIIIQADKDWRPQPAELAAWQDVLDGYGAADRKGAPLGLTGGGTATRVSMTLKDLLPDDILDRVEATVAAAFGVPAVVLGFLVGLKNSPWSQMAEARRMAYEDTIEPMWRRDAALLTQKLLRAPFGRGKPPVDEDRSHLLTFDTDTVRALQADQLRQAEIAEKNSLYWTVDEGRVFTGKDKLPAGDPRADVIPGLATAPAEAGPEAEDETEAEGAPGGQEAEATAPAKARAPRAVVQGKATRADRWKLWDARVGGLEFGWELAAGEQLAKDQELVLRLVQDTLRTSKADGDPVDPASVRALREKLADEAGAMEARWKGALQPHVLGTARASAQLVASQVGVGFDVLEPGLVKFTQTHAAQLVKGIVETTRDEVRAALAAGLKEGEGIPELSARIQGAGAFGPARAKLIARTETTTVTNRAGRGAIQTWASDNGQRVVKSWLATADARTRDEHRELDGEERPIGKAFSNGLQEPSEPNCRCTLEYRILEEED